MNSPEAPGSSLLRQLRRRWMIVVAVTLVATVAAYVISSASPKSYTVNALLLAQPNSAEIALLGGSVALDSGTQARELSTLQALAGARPVAVATSALMNGTQTPTDVQNKVKAAADPNANDLTVSATDSVPTRAAQLANSFSRALIGADTQRQRAAARASLGALQQRRAALAPGGRRTAAARTLTDQIAKLRVLALAGPSVLSVAQPAVVPGAPNSSTLRNTVLGALFGLLLGCGIALVREQVDRRVRTEENLEAETGLPVLAEVPNSRALRRGAPLSELSPGEVEAFRLLWTRLRFGYPGRELKRVLITSAGPEEGKSTISWYLASVAAAGGARVLLVEGDVRRPVLQARHGVVPRAGLVDVLRRGLPLAEAVTEVAVAAPQANGTDPHTLHVLAADGRTNELSGIALIDRLIELLRDGVGGYELVIVDSPPLALAAESIALVTAADGVLVTSRPGRTDRDALGCLLSELDRLGASPIGVVFDGREGRSYGYYATADAPTSAVARD